jgi:exosortase/archaeosortase family protein
MDTVAISASPGAATFSRGRFLLAVLLLAAFVHLTFLVRGGDNSGDWLLSVAGWSLVALVFAVEPCQCGPVPASATAAALSLAGFGVLQCARMTATDLWFLKILALLLFGGVVLSCSGWRGTGNHWRSVVLILMMLAPEKGLIFVDYGGALTRAHAAIAGFLLHCFGVDILIRGDVLVTRAGAVKVEEACSGMVLMLLLFKLALMVCFALRLRMSKGILTCSGALLAGFATGVIRICVLTLVQGNRWFEMLHGALGMNLFPLIGFLLFAPLLFHAEEPFEILLRQALRRWKDSTRISAGGYRIALLSLIGGGYGICLVAGEWMQPQRFLPLAPNCTAQGLSLNTAVPVAVPDDLRARRFNGVQDARHWRIEKSGKIWDVLACAISDALLGPVEIVKEPEFARFVERELGHRNSPALRGPGAAAASPAAGSMAIVGIDAGNRRFIDTLGFNAAQRSAVFQAETWKDWLRSGHPLKDCRYNLFLIAPVP